MSRLDEWRRIERLLMGEMTIAERRRAWTWLRGDPIARQKYDTAIAALRLLEGDPILGALEVDRLEDWVLDDLEPVPRAVERSWPRLSILFALAAALLVALILRPRAPEHDDPFAARGLAAGPSRLALQALCSRPGAAIDHADALGASAELRCAGDDVLGFAYRVDPDARGRQLTLFGVDAQGDPMFYAPTPIDDAAIAVKVGQWAAVDIGVQLSVNHAEGPLVVYGLLAPRAATVSEVRDIARALETAPAVRLGDPPWPQRIGWAHLTDLCATPRDCDGVQLRLWVEGVSR